MARVESFRNLIVSIIVPVQRFSLQTYEKIHELIDATDDHFEIIFLMPLSDKQEVEVICESLPLERVSIYFGEFSNQGDARNFGITKSKAPWVFFLDDDDSIEPTSILDITRHASLQNVDIAIGGIRIQQANRPEIYKNHYLHSAMHALESLAIFPAFTRIVYRKSFLKDVVFASSKMGEDQYFLLSIMLKRPKFISQDIILYYYNVGNPNQSTRNPIALSELPISMKQTLNLNNNEQKLRNYFLISQCLTVVKHFNFREIFNSRRVLSLVVLNLLTEPLINLRIASRIIRMRRSLL